MPATKDAAWWKEYRARRAKATPPSVDPADESLKFEVERHKATIARLSAELAAATTEIKHLKAELAKPEQPKQSEALSPAATPGGVPGLSQEAERRQREAWRAKQKAVLDKVNRTTPRSGN
jgi:hypothetical protein